jgi:hypothetical protein
MKEEIKDQTEDAKKETSEVNTGPLTMSLFTLTAVIYFANAGYSYYKNIEGQVGINIALGVMFFCIGLSFLTSSKDKKK